ncbi:MAG: N-acetylmuramoyl-L-alanine amidase [Planctomycetes bacterium]|nr:N-acetylmuramoyl-L-alanine amidase [Planctomycetota bacterium]
MRRAGSPRHWTVAAVLLLSMVSLHASSASAAWKICIDPGHGGSDPGAGANGLHEAALNLDASLRLKDLLNADTADAGGGSAWTVLLTRTTNVFVSLSSRVSYANSNGCHRFVSIHTNSGGGYGSETFMYYDGSATSADQRNKIQEEVLEHGQRYNRGVKLAGFYVIKYTSMPATLTEMAFVDNAGDAAKLGSPAWRQQIARAHLHALQRSFGGSAYDPGAGSAPPPPGPTYLASLVGVTAPASLQSGKTAVVTVKLKNLGTATWTPAAVRLGTASPYDHPSLFFRSGNWLSQTRPAALASNTAPGAIGSFSFTIQAPPVTSASSKTETLQARFNESAWFGPQVNFTVAVAPPTVRPPFDAILVSATYDDELYLSETTTVTVKLYNAGTQTWTPTNVRLGTWGPPNRLSALKPPAGWLSPTRPATVTDNTPAGGVGVFTFQLKAPAQLETVVVSDEEFRLVQTNGTWFGPSVIASIVITPIGFGGPPPDGGHGH